VVKEVMTFFVNQFEKEKVVVTKQPTISEPLSFSMPFKKEQRLR
jgi:hypothetical protein